MGAQGTTHLRPPLRKATPATGAGHPPIRARRTRFDLSATPLHWVPGDPQTTQTLNVLHLLLPPGERWFCDVLREALPLVGDEALRADVKGFIGQEATHARAHDQGVAHLADHGMDMSGFVRFAEGVRRAYGPRPLGRDLGPRAGRAWLVHRVAIIAAIEHFTSVLGTWIVEHADALDEAGADPAMMDLLRWHGAEEVEHRSVAFDMAAHLNDSHALRVATMVPVGVVLAVLWCAAARQLIAADPATDEPFRVREWRRAVRQGRLPSLRSLGAATRRYLRRDHHPSDEPGNRDRALAYLASSPGVRAQAAAG